MAERTPVQVVAEAVNSVKRKPVVPCETVDYVSNVARFGWETPNTEDPFEERREAYRNMTGPVKVSMNGGDVQEHQPTPGETMFPTYHGPRGKDGWPQGPDVPQKVGA